MAKGNRMKRFFVGLGLSLALLSSTAFAKPGYREIVRVPFVASDGTSFSAEDMTGPAQTEVIDIRGFAWVTLYVSVAAVTGTANVTVKCFVGPTSADANYQLQSENVAAGSSTFSDYSSVKSVTTSKKYPITFNVANHSYMYCTFTCASGTVSASLYGGH